MERGGFSFDNCVRNAMLESAGYQPPKARKTGTTICGVIFEGGVVLGADTRATSGNVVFEKNCEKIHYIAPNIYCCGAGTAADTENTTGLIASQLELHRLSTGRESRVITSLTMLKQMLFKYQGHVSAALVLGGVDLKGPHLYTVYPHGSSDSLPYVTMGSGSLAAMAVFEANYKDNLTEEEAKLLVKQAISAGIFNDLGSGGNVNLCVIKKGKTEVIKGYAQENPRKYRRPAGYSFPTGTTSVLESKFQRPVSEIAVVTEVVSESVSMET
ncbi:Proteasome subunit beta type-7-B [Porphyridium purpureum]|uniref:Proteasome subunit beta n=1 Tax=Porphyridium purpureum TaxID=35688 RepID=A0A5J4YPZ8_PORPP|nr:Proteasome subunit beta type-7-B [Porphyridium purpureum]|eukprot:POR4224..scf222_8